MVGIGSRVAASDFAGCVATTAHLIYVSSFANLFPGIAVGSVPPAPTALPFLTSGFALVAPESGYSAVARSIPEVLHAAICRMVSCSVSLALLSHTRQPLIYNYTVVAPVSAPILSGTFTGVPAADPNQAVSYRRCVFAMLPATSSTAFILSALKFTDVACLANCNQHGNCHPRTGACVCFEGWTGAVCNQRACAHTCRNGGSCNSLTGTCSCPTGFDGPTCSAPTCVPSAVCSNHGVCNSLGMCECTPPYVGADCASLPCPNDCNSVLGKGLCQSGTCSCGPGFTGDDCSVARCPSDCASMGGVCNSKTGQCTCIDGLTVSNGDCTLGQCPNACSGNGSCNFRTRACTCYGGFVGLDCAMAVPLS